MTLRPDDERRLLRLFALVQLTLLLDFMIMMPLGPELMRALALSPAMFGGLVSSYTFASATASLTGSYWLDRVERRRVLLALYAVFIVCTLACGLFTSALGMLSARIVAGGSAGLLWASIMAVIVESVPAERRGGAIGTVMSSYAVSAVVGVPLALSIAAAWSFRAPFFALAALSLVLWLALFRMLPRGGSPRAAEIHDAASPSSGRAPQLWFSNPNFVLGWSLTFVGAFAGFLLIPYLSTFMLANLGLRAWHLPWAYLCGGALTFFTMRRLGALADSRGPAPVLGCLLVATMVLHLAFTHLEHAPVWGVIGLFVLFMAVTSGRIVPTITLITSRVPKGMRGRFMAVNTATSDVASGLAAWLSGALLRTGSDGSLVGFRRMGWLAVTTSSLALFVLWLFCRSAEPAPRFTERSRPAGG